MNWHDFSFKGVLASSMGVVAEKQAEYVSPADETEQVKIPGRDGKLTLCGTGSLDQTTYAPECWVKPGADRVKIAAWLQGAGTLILGSMPEFALDARIFAGIPYADMWEGQGQNGWTSFTPVFVCQPWRLQAVPCADIKVTQSGGELLNPGTMDALPLISVAASGSFSLTVGGGTVLLTNVPGGIIIDCDAMECTSGDGTKLLNNLMDGDFPVIPPGASWVTWSLGQGASVDCVTVKPRWRWR